MGTQERIESDDMAEKSSDGKDEMNLAEFPLCALAHRPRPDQKTLHFEDQVWDKSREQHITRRLTITGSEAFGLPTALDDEVLLALIQISKSEGFAERKVRFTRYRLIRLLGWRNEGKSYERLEASLNRWMGVALVYQNAWWDRPTRRWVSEKFHILDNVTLVHRAEHAEVEDRVDGSGVHSTFVWNDVLFRSFRAGNLKSIDFGFYNSLRSAVAKRLYRFLDKRFFHQPRWEFDLRELACEHVGLARGYDVASLKRKLMPGILELEGSGYLESSPAEERFNKITTGHWRVKFTKADAKPAKVAEVAIPGSEESLVRGLVQRGVTLSRARHTAREYPPERITSQVEVFDWMVARVDPKVSRNPPGFLLAAIKDQYAPPREFLKHREAELRKKKVEEKKQRLQARQQQRQASQESAEREYQRELWAFWSSLPESERKRREEQAIAEAPTFQRKLMARGGSSGTAAKKNALDAYASRQLKKDSPGRSGGQ